MEYNDILITANKLADQKNKIKNLKEKLKKEFDSELNNEILELERQINKINEKLDMEVERMLPFLEMAEYDKFKELEEQYNKIQLKYESLHFDDSNTVFPFILKLLEHVEGEEYVCKKIIIEDESNSFIGWPLVAKSNMSKEVINIPAYIFIARRLLEEKFKDILLNENAVIKDQKLREDNSRIILLKEELTDEHFKASNEIDGNFESINLVRIGVDGGYSSLETYPYSDFIYLEDFVSEILKRKIKDDIQFMNNEVLQNIFDEHKSLNKRKNIVVRTIRKIKKV